MSSNSHVELPFNQDHAFIIGINDYEHITPLKTAVNDAKGLAERLEAQHGYLVHGPYLDATREELETLFKETMPALVKEEDRVLFYFAGHGIALDGEEGPNGYIVPKDAKQGDRDSLLPMNLLHDSINALPCQHGMLILDCCFSGAFKWSTGFRDVMFDLPKVIYEERFWRYVKDPAWQVITSSAYDQKAVDVISNQSIGMREEGEGIHSPFAKALFEAIDGAGDVIPVDKGDGVITASELYAFLRDAVESKTNEQAIRQSPSMFNLGRHDKGEFIFLNPRHRFNLEPTPDRNPFMGLVSYEEADSNYFFGRDRVIEALVEKVKKNPLTVVSGASGTGKSSVIKAGLLPHLRKEGWKLLPVIRPGKEPMRVLADELPDFTKLFHPDKKLQSIEMELEALMQGAQIDRSGNDSIKYLLIIDQYEELITQCIKEKDREAFEGQLKSWIQQYEDLHIILSVRSDFEPQFESQALAKWWQEARYVVPGFSLEEIREIIVKPALQAVLFYEPIELTDKLQEDMSQAPGALPLLSFTLSELYYAYLKSGRQDRSLTTEDYQKIGGVIGALRSKADEVYLNNDQAHQASMRKLMFRMVSLDGGELAGRRVYEDELFFSNPEESQRIETITKQMINARLVLKGKDLQNRIYIEPAHDALVRAWARLWDWIKTVGEEKLIWQNKLSQAVGDYHDLLKEKPSEAENLLWNSDPRLDLLNEELSKQSHNFNDKEEAFIRKSVELRTKKRKQLVRNISLVAIALLVLSIVAIFMYFQSVNKGKVVQAESFASQALLETETHSTLAIHSALAAYEGTPEPSLQSKRALLNAFYAGNKHPYYIQIFEGRTEFSADGKYIVSDMGGGELGFWDLEGNRQDSPPNQVHTFRSDSIDFAKVNMEVLADSFDGIETGEIQIKAFHPGKNRTIVSGTEDLGAHFSKPLAIYFNEDQEEISILEKGYQPGVYGFSSDGNLFFAANYDPAASIIVIWDAIAGKRLYRLGGGINGEVKTATFSPDGKKLISQDENGQSLLWDLNSTTLSQQIIPTKSNSFFLKIADNGQAFISEEGDEWILRSMNGDILFRRSLQETYDNVPDVSPDANHLLYRKNEREIILENLKKQERLTIRCMQDEDLSTAQFVFKGQQVLLQCSNSLRFFDLAGNQQKVLAFEHSAVIESTDNGRNFYSVRNLDRGPDYEMETNPELRVIIWENDQASSDTLSLSYRSDSDDEPETLFQYFPEQQKFLIGVSTREYYNSTIQMYKLGIFDLQSHQKEVVKLGSGISTLASSYDYSLLAGVSEKVVYASDSLFTFFPETERSTIELWSIDPTDNSFQKIFTYPGHEGYIQTIAFSPDGKRIISAGEDNTLRIWFTPQGAYEQIKNTGYTHLSEKQVQNLIGLQP